MSDTTDNRLAAHHGWELDPERSTAEFDVRTFWGLTNVHGRFHELAGHIGQDGQLELEIQSASLETGNRQRDRHLRSKDFFDAEHHPHVRFSSTGIEQAGDGSVRVVGELEAAGQSVRVELEPSVSKLGDGELEVHAQTTIDQRQLGMTYRRLGIRTPATLTVHAVLHPGPQATNG